MKTFQYIKRSGSEYITYNKVDKDVQAIFSSLQVIQYIMFCPKYRIKNDRIMPNNFMSRIILMIVTVVVLILFIVSSHLLALENDTFGYTTFLLVSSQSVCVMYCFGFVMNFLIGVLQTNNSIQFILIFQRVHRFLSNGDSVKPFISSSWFLGITVGIYVIICISLQILLRAPFCAVYVSYLTLVFDFNIFYGTRILKLLENKVLLWNDQVLRTQEMEVTHLESYVQQLYKAYIDILKCYNIYKVCFQQLILFYIIEVFLQTLIYIQVIIETFKKDIASNNMELTTLLSFYVTFYVIKNLMWHTALIQQCEKFYLAVERVPDCAITILKTTYSDAVKRLCKNVLRLHRASFNKIRVCGLFDVDAALQLCILGLSTNYTIVLLQFAFL